MTGSDDIFKLIKSLTKGEKKFFKLYSSLIGGSKNYLKIFKVIEKQKIYDEEKVKEKLAYETFIKHFAYEKNYLQKVLLKALRQYHAENSINSQLHNSIQIGQVLHKKHLNSLNARHLEKAKKLAYKYELYPVLIEILDLQSRMLLRKGNYSEFGNSAEKYFSEKQKAVEKYTTLSRLNLLYYRVYEYDIIYSSSDKFKLRALAKKTVGILKKEKDSFRIKERCLAIAYIIEANLGNHKRSLVFGKTCVDLFYENSHFIEDMFFSFFAHSSNLINRYYDLKKYSEALVSLNNLKEIMKNAKGLAQTEASHEHKNHIFAIELEVLYALGKFQEALHVVDDYERNSSKTSPALHKHHIFLNYINISRVYLANNMYKQALRTINKFINSDYAGVRKDDIHNALMLRIIIHYEIGNFDLLESLGLSAIKMSTKADSPDIFLQKFGRMSTELSKADEPNLRKSIFIKTSKELLSVKSSSIIEYRNLIYWIKSKIENKTFKEVVIQDRRK